MTPTSYGCSSLSSITSPRLFMTCTLCASSRSPLLNILCGCFRLLFLSDLCFLYFLPSPLLSSLRMLMNSYEFDFDAISSELVVVCCCWGSSPLQDMWSSLEFISNNSRSVNWIWFYSWPLLRFSNWFTWWAMSRIEDWLSWRGKTSIFD